jgi:hypothetical protein
VGINPESHNKRCDFRANIDVDNFFVGESGGKWSYFVFLP